MLPFHNLSYHEDILKLIYINKFQLLEEKLLFDFYHLNLDQLPLFQIPCYFKYPIILIKYNI